MTNLKTFFDQIRSSIFQGRMSEVQVQSAEAIIRLAEEKGLSLNVASYMLATAWGETRMAPVREGFKDTDAQARAYVRKQGYKYAKAVNGHVYYGRGLVQLTWYKNYRSWGIENNPDKALEPAFAAKVLVTGMLDGRYNGRRKGIEFYLDRAEPDWENARRTVNITDKWELFRSYAIVFRAALRKAKYGSAKAKPPEPFKPKDVTTGKGDTSSTTIWTSFGSAIATIATAVAGLGKEQPLLAFGICVMAVGVFLYLRYERKEKARKFGI